MYRSRYLSRQFERSDQDRHFLHILRSQKTRITKSQMIQPFNLFVWWIAIVYIISFLIYSQKSETNLPKKHPTKNPLHPVSWSRWQGEFDVIVWATMQTKRNYFFIFYFICVVVPVPLLYSRCFRNHRNLFYEFRFEMHVCICNEQCFLFDYFFSLLSIGFNLIRCIRKECDVLFIISEFTTRLQHVFSCACVLIVCIV